VRATFLSQLHRRSLPGHRPDVQMAGTDRAPRIPARSSQRSRPNRKNRSSCEGSTR
jgi:hypothetical protein